MASFQAKASARSGNAKKAINQRRLSRGINVSRGPGPELGWMRPNARNPAYLLPKHVRLVTCTVTSWRSGKEWPYPHSYCVRSSMLKPG